MRITEIIMPEEKSRLCNDTLRALPSWFGIEQSIVEYVEAVAGMPFYVAQENEESIGFVAIKVHSADTCEVCVMGVLPQHHRNGAGRALVEACEAYGRSNGMTFLTVKTLDGSRADEGYAKTRRFYTAMGFKPLEVFPLLWDEANPCLFMAKYIGG